MRVIFVQPTGDRSGHFGLYTSKLCEALAKAGHEVLLCTSRLAVEDYLKAPIPFEIVSLQGETYAFAGLDDRGRRFSAGTTWAYLWNSWQVTRRAIALARDRGFDLVHVSGAEYGALALLALRAGGRPPLITELSAANFNFASYSGPRGVRLYKELQRRLLQLAFGRGIQGVTILGDVLATQLPRQLRFGPKLQQQVVYDGGDEPTEILEPQAARRRLGWPEVPTFLFFGVLRRDKGWPVLLQAMALLRDMPCRLVVAGQPVECQAQQVHDEIDRLQLADRVTARLEFLPEAELSAYILASDAVVLPYAGNYTGGSGPFLRGACRHRRPVIATNVAEMGDMIARYDCGIGCRPESPEALAEAMRRFLGLPRERREQMAENGWRLAASRSWAHMAQSLSSLYQRVIQTAA